MPDTSVKLQDITPVKSTFDSDDQLLLIGLTGEARISKEDFLDAMPDDAITLIGDITTTGIEGDTVAKQLGALENTKAPAITDTASGVIANFPDGADDMPVVDLTVNIEPKQDLTYGDPYPAGGSKNKASVNELTGIGWAANNSDLLASINSLESGTYTLSFGLKITSVTKTGSWQYGFVAANANGNVSRYESVSTDPTVNYTNSLTYTFSISSSQAGAFTAFYIYGCGSNAQGKMGEATLSNIQIESGSAKTSFVPYSNICPITGWTGANVYRTGKNLCSSAIGRYLWAGGVRYANNAKYCAFEDKVAVKGGEQIAVSFTDAGTCSGIYFAFFNGETYIEQSIKWGAPWTTSVPDNANMVALSFLNNVDYTTSPVISNVMLTYGSTASEYEPYQGTTVTVDWSAEAGTVYGGTIDVATGLLTVTDGYIASYNGETLPSTWISDRDVYASGTTPTTGAQVVYKLATPITYQLTPTEVKTLLGTNNIWSNTGDTTVDYRADTKLYIEKLTMPTEDDMTANQAITSGKFFMVGNNLYIATAAIASGAKIIEGTNATRLSLADALNRL